MAAFFAVSVGGVFINSSLYGAPLLLTALFCLAFFFLEKRCFRLGTILCTAFLLRLFSALVFPTAPFSDYLKYHEAAIAAANGKPLDPIYFGAFPHALNYSITLAPVYKVFGANEVIIYALNAVLGTFCVFLLYKCALVLTNNEKTSKKCALLYAVYPTAVFYTSILATEIPHTLFCLLALFTAVKSKKTVNAVLTGIFASLMNFVRPTGIIFIIAYVIYLIFYDDDKKARKLKRIICMLLAYISVMGALNFTVSHLTDLKTARAPFGYNLYVGMNEKTLGRWNEEDYSRALLMAKNPQKMHADLGKMAWKRFINNGFSGNTKLFFEKFALTWGSDSLICFYMKNNALFKSLVWIFVPMCMGFRLYIAVLGVLCIAKKRSNMSMLPVLLVLGTAALHLFTETMERYVYASVIICIMLFETEKKKGLNIMLKNLMADINAVLERDPASTSKLSVYLLSPGVKALRMHRRANFFWRHNMKFIATAISMRARKKTGIEIHPGAKIGKGVLIDHGMGVVIGETAEVGDGCTIYQNVTLGGTGKDTGKRHPTIGKNVLIGAGAKVLGPFSVGDNSKIAANAVVLSEVPPDSTCVGVPARVIKQNNKRVHDCRWQLDQTHIPDPVSQELCKLSMRIDVLERKEKSLENRP